jgi:hypothetical protein
MEAVTDHPHEQLRKWMVIKQVREEKAEDRRLKKLVRIVGATILNGPFKTSPTTGSAGCLLSENPTLRNLRPRSANSPSSWYPSTEK